MCVLTAPTTRCCLISSHSPKASLFPDTTILKLSQLITLQQPVKCSSETNSPIPLTLNQKPEMIKPREESMSKAERSQKLGFLCQKAMLWMQRKSYWRKYKCYSTEYTNDKKAEQPYCRHWGFGGLDRSNSNNIPLSQRLIQSKLIFYL